MRKFYVIIMAIIWLTGSQMPAQVPSLQLSKTEFDSVDQTNLLKERVNSLRRDIIPAILDSVKVLRMEYAVNFPAPSSLKGRLSGQVKAEISISLNALAGDTVVKVFVPKPANSPTASAKGGKQDEEEEEDYALSAVLWSTKTGQRFYAEVAEQNGYSIFLLYRAADSLLVSTYSAPEALENEGNTPFDMLSFGKVITAIADSSAGTGVYVKLTKTGVQQMRFSPNLQQVWSKGVKDARWVNYRKIVEGEEKTFIQR